MINVLSRERKSDVEVRYNSWREVNNKEIDNNEAQIWVNVRETKNETKSIDDCECRHALGSYFDRIYGSWKTRTPILNPNLNTFLS
jgi:hypothetical protein